MTASNTNTSDGANAIQLQLPPLMAKVAATLNLNHTEVVALLMKEKITQEMADSMKEAQIQTIFDMYSIVKEHETNTHNNDPDDNKTENNISKEEPEPEPEPEQKQNVIVIEDQEVVSAVERIAKHLFTYHTYHTTATTTNNSQSIQELFSEHIPQILEDFLLLQTTDEANLSWHLFEYVDQYLRIEYFHGSNECRMHLCRCMNINTRDRNQPFNHSHAKNKLNVCDLLLSTIHCSLLHSFESGYRMTQFEIENLMKNSNSNGTKNKNKNKNKKTDDDNDSDSDDDDDEEDENENDNEHGFHMDLLNDKQASKLKHILSVRRDNYRNMRNDMNANANANANTNTHSNANNSGHGNTAMQMGSKFVTVIDEEDDEAEPEQESDANTNTNTSTLTKSSTQLNLKIKKMVGYGFGNKFYYWTKYENNDTSDTFYNGGRHTYGDWFIAKKYDSFKTEVTTPLATTTTARKTANANASASAASRSICISAELWADELVKVQHWFLTADVRRLRVTEHYRRLDFGIDSGTAISEVHLLALAFYTNLTFLCTMFSRVFRRIPSSESDASLRARNAHYREWARLLIETIHVFGVQMDQSKIDIFYHGISIEMTFPSTYAIFCSPTSTTDSFPVAVNFASKGMVLELKNNGNEWLTFFPCTMSDFSNEREKLFMNGGYCDESAELGSVALSFRSIRSLDLNLDYRQFITAISAFETILKGLNGVNNRLKSKKINVRALQQLIKNQLLATADHNNNNNNNNTQQSAAQTQIAVTEHASIYVQSMFDNYVRSATTAKIQICTPFFNCRQHHSAESHLFYVYRNLFCEFYAPAVMDANRSAWALDLDGITGEHFYHNTKLFVNPIRSLKIELLLDLCPNVRQFEIISLAVTHALMKQFLKIISVDKVQKHYLIERLFVGCFFFEDESHETWDYPLAQSDFYSEEIAAASTATNNESAYVVMLTECKRQYQQLFTECEWTMNIIEKQQANIQNDLVSGMNIVSNRASIDDKRVWESFLK